MHNVIEIDSTVKINPDAIPASVKLETKPCPLGCEDGDRILFSGKDRLGNLPGIYTVVQCCTCGLIRTNPRPTPETMGFYYQDDYGPYLGTQLILGGKSDGASLKLVKRLIQKIFVTHSLALPDLPVGRLLEIGCASGAFLHQMVSKGWSAKGIEFSQSAVESCKRIGLDVNQGALESIAAPTHLYDLIVCWMVMEHLHEPLLGLKRLHEWSTANAYLVLSVPNVASIDFKFKNCGYGLQLPHHLFHYTPLTISRILEATGWKVEKIIHQRSSANLVRSISYKLQDMGLGSLARLVYWFGDGKGSLLLYPFSWLLSLFGETGRMTIWARKV